MRKYGSKKTLWTFFTLRRASEIVFLDIGYLITHSFGYFFYFEKNTKTSKWSKPRDPINFIFFTENQSLYVCQCIALYIERTKEKGRKNSQLLLSFIRVRVPVPTQLNQDVL